MEQLPSLREDLVSELVARRPDFRSIVDTLHHLCHSFQSMATTPFAVPAPTTLSAESVRGARIFRSQLMLFHRTITLRSASLLINAIRSLNESGLLQFAFSVRGILETAAAVAYHQPRLVLSADERTIPEDYGARLRNAMMASRFDWNRFFTDHAARLALIDEYNNSQDLRDLSPTETATNVLTMLEALARRLKATTESARGIIFHDYSLLSDLCHPAAGSYLLFACEAEAEMRADLSPPHETVLGLTEILVPTAAYSAQTVMEVLAELEDMDERLATAHPYPNSTPSPSSEQA